MSWKATRSQFWPLPSGRQAPWYKLLWQQSICGNLLRNLEASWEPRPLPCILDLARYSLLWWLAGSNLKLSTNHHSCLSSNQEQLLGSELAPQAQEQSSGHEKSDSLCPQMLFISLPRPCLLPPLECSLHESRNPTCLIHGASPVPSTEVLDSCWVSDCVNQNQEGDIHLEWGDYVRLLWPLFNEVTGGFSQTAVGPVLFLCQSLAGSSFVRTVTSAWSKDSPSAKHQSRLMNGTDTGRHLLAGRPSKDAFLSRHKMQDWYLCPDFHLCSNYRIPDTYSWQIHFKHQLRPDFLFLPPYRELSLACY